MSATSRDPVALEQLVSHCSAQLLWGVLPSVCELARLSRVLLWGKALFQRSLTEGSLRGWTSAKQTEPYVAGARMTKAHHLPNGKFTNPWPTWEVATVA